jgi:protein-tyrosine phosphatase
MAGGVVKLIKTTLVRRQAQATKLSQAVKMIDLHCHILPGIDDGAANISVSIEMARAFVADGVSVVACTPHILPGLYANSGPQIRVATAELQQTLSSEGVPLQLVTGADNHITPDFVAALSSGHLLSLADTRYVLVEPPHHIAPPRMEVLFFNLVMAGYVPILTHPERLTWIKSHYQTIKQLLHAGVWMQLTAGSLAGAFGRNAQYWSERMLDEGCVHLLATDAHDVNRRPPNLRQGRELASKRVGDNEAEHLVVTRPRGVLLNDLPSKLPPPPLAVSSSPSAYAGADVVTHADDVDGKGHPHTNRGSTGRGFIGGLRSIFKQPSR